MVLAKLPITHARPNLLHRIPTLKVIKKRSAHVVSESDASFAAWFAAADVHNCAHPFEHVSGCTLNPEVS